MPDPAHSPNDPGTTAPVGPPVALREPMRVTRGRVPLLERHLARLVRGGAPESVAERVRREALQLASAAVAHEFARISVTVTPDGCIAAAVSRDASSLAVHGGPIIAPVEVAEPPELPPGAAKPASRRYWDRAHAKARLAGAHQAVLHLPNGTLIDGSTATVWLVFGEHLLTPPSPPALGGVAREVIFEQAGNRGIEVAEATLTVADLAAADEVWLSNGIGGMVPARGRGGPFGEGVAAIFVGAVNIV